jgi:hypothetical protein
MNLNGPKILFFVPGVAGKLDSGIQPKIEKNPKARKKTSKLTIWIVLPKTVALIKIHSLLIKTDYEEGRLQPTGPSWPPPAGHPQLATHSWPPHSSSIPMIF